MAKPKQSSGIKNDPEPQPDQPEPKRPAEQQGGEPTRSRRTFRPPVDIYETENGLMLVADVPGATAEGMTVTLERRALSVHAGVEDDSPEGHSLVPGVRGRGLRVPVHVGGGLRCRPDRGQPDEWCAAAPRSESRPGAGEDDPDQRRELGALAWFRALISHTVQLAENPAADTPGLRSGRDPDGDTVTGAGV